jgi:hypothetical protein
VPNDGAPLSMQAAKRRTEADQFEDLLVPPCWHLGRLRTPPQVLYYVSVLARALFSRLRSVTVAAEISGAGISDGGVPVHPARAKGGIDNEFHKGCVMHPSLLGESRGESTVNPGATYTVYKLKHYQNRYSVPGARCPVDAGGCTSLTN